MVYSKLFTDNIIKYYINTLRNSTAAVTISVEFRYTYRKREKKNMWLVKTFFFSMINPIKRLK